MPDAAIHSTEYVALHIKRTNVRSIIAVLEKCQGPDLSQALWAPQSGQLTAKTGPNSVPGDGDGVLRQPPTSRCGLMTPAGSTAAGLRSPPDTRMDHGLHRCLSRRGSRRRAAPRH